MNNNNYQAITWQGSLFLDTLRLASALTVLYIHAHDLWYPSLVHSPNQPGNVAHSAVVVFFVLSGYVIAHTTTSNNRGKLQYISARLSRLYSIVLPALIITACIEVIVKRTDPVLASSYSRGLSWPRYLFTGGFLNEIWFLSAAPPINIPLWSLSFEFWYYAIFGFWFYRTVGWKSLIMPILSCLVAGPKILLMMPIWLFGYAAYRMQKNTMVILKGWHLVFISLGIAIFLVIYLRPFPYNIGLKPFYFANQFITDWIIGVFIAIALWFLPSKTQNPKKPDWIVKFRKIADLTFPIYVLHHPLLVLWRSLYSQTNHHALQMWIAIIMVFLISVTFGLILERQRHTWFTIFNYLVRSIKLRMGKSRLFVNTSPKTL